MPVQQQQDDQPAAALAAWAGDGGGEGAHDLPSLRRPLLPCPEAQGAQAQVTLPSNNQAIRRLVKNGILIFLIPFGL